MMSAGSRASVLMGVQLQAVCACSRCCHTSAWKRWAHGSSSAKASACVIDPRFSFRRLYSVRMRSHHTCHTKCWQPANFLRYCGLIIILTVTDQCVLPCMAAILYSAGAFQPAALALATVAFACNLYCILYICLSETMLYCFHQSCHVESNT